MKDVHHEIDEIEEDPASLFEPFDVVRGRTFFLQVFHQVLTDGHAPGEYRALTVRNLDAWYPAFGVKPGQALYLAPDDRVRVW